VLHEKVAVLHSFQIKAHQKQDKFSTTKKGSASSRKLAASYYTELGLTNLMCVAYYLQVTRLVKPSYLQVVGYTHLHKLIFL